MLALKLLVVIEGEVKEDTMEQTVDGLVSMENQMGSFEAGAGETLGVAGDA